MSKLGNIVDIKKGTKVEQTDFNPDVIRCIQIDDLRNDLNPKYCESKEKYLLANPSDVLIAWDGANAGTVGYGLTGAIGSTLARIRPNIENVDTRYLARLLQGKFQYLQDTSTGATIPHVNRKSLENIDVPLPELSKQCKIADVLDKTKSLIELRKTQTQKLDQLIKSRFIEMFGDPVVNPNGWEVKSLTAFYDSQDAVKCGPFGSALKKDEYVEQGVPVWVMDNITKNGIFIPKPFLYITPQKYSQLQSYSVEANDVIISRAGTVGKMCVVDDSFDKSIISTNLIRVRFNDLLLPLYFVMLLNVWGSRVCKLRTGSDGSFTHMNTGVLNSIFFPYPHLTLQNEFVNFVQQIDRSKFELQQGLEKLETTYESLMQKYFD